MFTLPRWRQLLTLVALLVPLTGCSKKAEPGPQSKLSPAEIEKAQTQIRASHLSPAAEAAALAELKRQSP